MDAGAVEEAEPARLDRIGRPRRDDAAGECARPRTVRNVPGRVERLVVDRVLPGGRLEACATHGDPVGLHELQALVKTEREGLAADEDVRAVMPGQRCRPPARGQWPSRAAARWRAG